MGGHAGADYHLMRNWVDAVSNKDWSHIGTTARDTLLLPTTHHDHVSRKGLTTHSRIRVSPPFPLFSFLFYFARR